MNSIKNFGRSFCLIYFLIAASVGFAGDRANNGADGIKAMLREVVKSVYNICQEYRLRSESRFKRRVTVLTDYWALRGMPRDIRLSEMGHDRGLITIEATDPGLIYVNANWLNDSNIQVRRLVLQHTLKAYLELAFNDQNLPYDQKVLDAVIADIMINS